MHTVLLLSCRLVNSQGRTLWALNAKILLCAPNVHTKPHPQASINNPT